VPPGGGEHVDEGVEADEEDPLGAIDVAGEEVQGVEDRPVRGVRRPEGQPGEELGSIWR
jgi:hypothetical protein